MTYSLAEADLPAPARRLGAAEPGPGTWAALRQADPQDGPLALVIDRPAGLSAARWLRRVALARLALPTDAILVVEPQEAGLAAASAALLAGAGAFGQVDLDRLQVDGAESAPEALVELERAIEDAGRLPLRRTAEGDRARAALSVAGRYRPIRPPTPPAT